MWLSNLTEPVPAACDNVTDVPVNVKLEPLIVTPPALPVFADSPAPAEPVAESAFWYDTVAVPVAVWEPALVVVYVPAPAEPVAFELGPADVYAPAAAASVFNAYPDRSTSVVPIFSHEYV